MTKTVVDTNILISAINYGGVSDQILDLARNKEIDLLTSPEILTEFADILHRKFEFTPERTREAVAQIQKISTLTFPVQRLNIIKKHESDNRILECAVEAKAQYIVSGDEHHLLPLGEFEGIKILSPAEFLRLI
jgi:putative PIN family toxin of toxin-antitoxin system